MVYTSLIPYQKHGVISILVFCQSGGWDSDTSGTSRSIRGRDKPRKHCNTFRLSTEYGGIDCNIISDVIYDDGNNSDAAIDADGVDGNNEYFDNP